jgi:hypothetical protein
VFHSHRSVNICRSDTPIDLSVEIGRNLVNGVSIQTGSALSRFLLLSFQRMYRKLHLEAHTPEETEAGIVAHELHCYLIHFSLSQNRMSLYSVLRKGAWFGSSATSWRWPQAMSMEVLMGGECRGGRDPAWLLSVWIRHSTLRSCVVM